MKQTRLESIIEVFLNTATGFVISWLVWLFVVPVFWPELATPPSVAFWLTVLFTVTSITRSYGWRRFFASDVHRAVHRFVMRLKHTN